MIGINKEFCFKVKECRRESAISQSELAKKINCQQSAISMFEKGDPTKLNDEAVGKLAEMFSLKLEDFGPLKAELPKISAVKTPLYTNHKGFCPNQGCPTNSAYEVDGKIYYLPDREKADPVGGKFCAFCGEVLEKFCPVCGTPVHDGGFCSVCATPYVAVE
jgi:DNA-binding XRE family transcriptional regulator